MSLMSPSLPRVLPRKDRLPGLLQTRVTEVTNLGSVPLGNASHKTSWSLLSEHLLSSRKPGSPRKPAHQGIRGVSLPGPLFAHFGDCASLGEQAQRTNHIPIASRPIKSAASDDAGCLPPIRAKARTLQLLSHSDFCDEVSWSPGDPSQNDLLFCQASTSQHQKTK